MKKLLIALIVVQIVGILVITAAGYVLFSAYLHDQNIAQVNSNQGQSAYTPVGLHFINDTESGLEAIADELSGIVQKLSDIDMSIERLYYK